MDMNRYETEGLLTEPATKPHFQLAVIYIKFEDPGHGWLEVRKSELVELGIAKQISSYSYMNGKMAYLEEDCDMGLFIETRWSDDPFKCRDHIQVHQQDPTPIKNYPCYRV